MILAQATTTPDANTTWMVIMSLFMVGSAAATIGLWWQGRQKQVRTIDPQPLVIKMAENYVHRTDFALFSQENQRIHEQLFSKLNGSDKNTNQQLEAMRHEMHNMELRINESGEQRSEKIHNRVNEVLESVSELRGEVRKK